MYVESRQGQSIDPWHACKLLVREPGDLWIGRGDAVRVGKAEEVEADLHKPAT
jgi:hypothetical protein